MVNDFSRFKIKAISLFAFLGVILLVIIAKLFYLMVFPVVEPDREGTPISIDNILRGNIYDRKGNLLALSKRVYNVVIHPDRIKEKKLKNNSDNENYISYVNNMAKVVSKILNLSEIEVKKKIFSDTKFQYLKKDVELSVKEELDSNNFIGLRFEPAFKREYPTQNLMSHIIGFVGRENNGLEGIEKQYNNELLAIKGPDNKSNGYFGNNLFLTIDKQMQEIVRSNLIKGLETYNAKSAVGIIYNPLSAEILAMCSIPDYDPYKRQPTPMSAIAGTIEPGSVFKVFASAILLEHNIVNKNTETDCGTPVNIGGRKIYPNTSHQYLKFEDVIKYSSNVGVIRNSLKLTDEQFYSGISEFGFGRKTGIDFPTESAGIFKPEEKMGSKESKAMISIGYEIGVTPLQLVVALGSIVNGGVISKPLLVSEIRTQEGQTVKKLATEIIGLSPAKNQDVSLTLIEMMRGVVQGGGTGKEANIKGIDIIGKTGTAQRLTPSEGYQGGKVNTTFFGVVKFMKDPIIILVSIQEPSSETWASKTSAPVFRDIVSDIIDSGLIFEY